MVHRWTFGICCAIVAAATAYASFVLPTLGIPFVVVATQIVVYGIIAAYAWVCRRHAAGSGMVLATAVLALPLTGTLLLIVSPPVGYGAGVFAILVVHMQVVVAVLGGYLGYSMLETSRLHGASPNAIQGKLAVMGLLALGVAAIAGVATTM